MEKLPGFIYLVYGKKKLHNRFCTKLVIHCNLCVTINKYSRVRVFSNIQKQKDHQNTKDVTYEFESSVYIVKKKWWNFLPTLLQLHMLSFTDDWSLIFRIRDYRHASQDLKRWFLYHSIVLMFYKHALLIHDTKCICLMFYVILRFFTPFRWFWIIFLENQIPVHSRQIVLGLHAKLDWFFLLFIL